MHPETGEVAIANNDFSGMYARSECETNRCDLFDNGGGARHRSGRTVKGGDATIARHL
jgi:hypothetical protein